MKFTRLRILGFKTFVEPTEFLIEPGLTGVVGPNGCGKSNLVEALRWVMGENSWKNMRASGMDDVIFSGSGRRPARNTAEVTLTLDNSDRTAPAHFNETDVLEVTRRIEREAGSVYKMNGKDVRARDVQLLFADASTGARSPALVRQGQIGELISAKPSARRMLLEEAAGISGLHSRRDEAEQRLQAAEQNMLRLEDVLREIGERIESLGKQSKAAARYRDVSAQIRTLEGMLALLEWRAVVAQLAEAEKAFTGATSSLAEKQAAQSAAATAQAVAAAALPKLRDEAVARAAAVQRIRQAATELDAEEARVRARLGEIIVRRTDSERDIAREQAMVADNDMHLARLGEEREELEAERAEEAERMEAAGARADDVAARVRAAEQRLETLTAEDARLKALRAGLDRQVAEAQERARRLDADLARTAAELAAIEDQLADRADLEIASEQLAMAQDAAEAAEGATLLAEQAEQDARLAETAARAPLSEAEKRLSQLDAEAATLARLLKLETGSLFPPLIDTLSVQKGYEAALVAAFGEDLDAPADEKAPAHWSGFAHPGDDPDLPPGAEPLARFVKGPALLARRLAQVGVVDKATGPALALLLKTGQCLVTLPGDLWRWDGFVVASGALTAAARRLQSRNRLAELDTARKAAQDDVAGHREAMLAAAAAAAVAAEGERAAREAWRHASRGLGLSRDRLSAAERLAGEIAARKRSVSDNLARLKADCAEALEAIEAALDARHAVPDDGSLQGEIETIRARVAEERMRLAESRAVAEGLGRESQLRGKRIEAILREAESWTARVAAAAGHLARLQERLAELLDEAARLEAMPEEFDERRRRIGSALKTAEAESLQAADALALAETRSKDADAAARAALEALAELREGRVRAEERLATARERRAEVAEFIGQRFECAPSALASLISLKPDQPLPEMKDTENRLHRLRMEREKMGGVNLSAEQELAEVEGRRDALVKERDDLTEAIRRLRLGIQSLNREARERLLAAFDAVDAHFRRLFGHLFGGGTAELKLVDSDDPLDAGLEIFARPPGKKPQTMTLLSGGEQALTCMALIFAVFLTNPAPICVLDEVDAPLDDANVERYCDLLDTMAGSTDTRFVVITHNPITMARMSRLFGVTMAERGVSQLVSVDLDQAARMVEAA